MFYIVLFLTFVVIVAMLKSSTRNKIILLVGLIVIALLHQITVVQQATARVTTTLHITIKYNEGDFTFQGVEYSPQFGAYFVSYIDKNGETISFQVESKSMPIVISYDPLNPGP